MTDERPLRPATADELEAVLAHALRFNGRKWVEQAGPFMAQIAADYLRRALQDAGYVMMKTPDATAPQAPAPYR